MGWLLICIVAALALIIGVAMWVVVDAFPDDEGIHSDGAGCDRCDARDTVLQRIAARKVKA